MFLFLNAALYQAGWMACTLGAAHGLPWVGPLAAGSIIGWHLVRARRVVDELTLVAVAAVCGLVFETALLQTGWVVYAGDWAPAYAGATNGAGATGGTVAPFWIVALWALFATTFNVSLRALRGRPVIAAVLGAVGAPAAYYAGARLGALELVS